jgi:hypothetical protein
MDSNRPVVGGEAATAVAVEPPTVERAHQLVAAAGVFDLTEHGEVCVAVRTAALQDVVADLDLWLELGWGCQLADGLCLCATHAFDRQ